MSKLAKFRDKKSLLSSAELGQSVMQSRIADRGTQVNVLLGSQSNPPWHRPLTWLEYSSNTFTSNL